MDREREEGGRRRNREKEGETVTLLFLGQCQARVTFLCAQLLSIVFYKILHTKFPLIQVTSSENNVANYTTIKRLK